MERCRKIVSLLVIGALLFEETTQVIVPGDQTVQKPLTSSPGIKTSHYKKPSSQIQFHHNYSRVFHQNGDSTSSSEDGDSSNHRPFPVYNAHSYGVKPPRSERLVIDGAKLDPTRTIVIHRKKKETSKIEVYSKCPTGETGQFVYELSCNQFLNCWKGRGYIQNCAPGTLFNPKNLECDFAQKVECITGPRRNTFRSQKLQNYEQVGCPQGFSGIIPNYSDCSKFINCANGIENALNCPPGTLFDIDKNLCDFAHKANCFNGQNEKLIDAKLEFGSNCGEEWCPNTKSQNQKSCGQEGCEKFGGSTKSRQEEVKCPEGAVGIHKHPSDCSKFLNCANGITYVQDCAPGTLFNPANSICDFPYNVKCDNQGGVGVTSTIEIDETQTEGYPRGHSNNGYNHQGSGPNFGQVGGGGGYGQNPAGNFGQHGGGGRYESGGSGGQGFKGGSGGHVQGQFGSHHNHQQPENGQDGDQDVHGQHSSSGDSHSSNQHSIGSGDGGSYGQSNHNPHQSFRPHQSINGQQQTGGNYHYQRGSSGYGQEQTGNGDSSHHHQGFGQHQTGPGYGQQGPNYQGVVGQGSSQHQTGFGQQGPNYQGVVEQGSSQHHTGSGYGQQGPSHQGGSNGVSGQHQITVGGHSSRNQDHHHSGYGWRRDQNHYQGTYDQNQDNFGNALGHGETTTANYDQVVNINHTPLPSRISPRPKSYQNRVGDYDDTVGTGHSSNYVATTPRGTWPPPFPSTDVNADYVFEYDDEEVTLEAENSIKDYQRRKNSCEKGDFVCSSNNCISKMSVCDTVKDCGNGADEISCVDHLGKFNWTQNAKLAVLELERWDNVTMATCAFLCLDNQKFRCKSFNYRKIDRTCFLTNTNVGLTGALISYFPCDYYELIQDQLDCSDMFRCDNNKCLRRNQICDGHDDCGDRMDEKGCKPEDFGYSIKLAGSKNPNEGQIEVTAFGRTGYICDDKFGLRDANIVCRELGFALGAAEVKSNSFYQKIQKEDKPFYMMDDISCLGNETTLLDCDFSGWGVHNCLGQEIAGVVCKTPQEKCPKDYWQCDTGQECLPLAFICDGLLDCTDGSDEGSQHCDAPIEIRLANGSNNQEGRLEIKHHGTWGTVCDDDFNEDAAKVVCQNLGYKGSAVVKKDAYFGPGDGPIWLDQVFCSGNETSIETCTHWNWGEHNCEHSEDVGVICSNIYQTERHAAIIQPPSTYPTKCGYRKDNQFNIDDNIHQRVVKGSIAKKGDYPWQAAIRVKGKTSTAHWCGAVVISEKFVLTAAHCLIGYSKGAYVVVAGDYDVDQDETTEQEAYIEDFYIHEDFRKGHKMNNDIALIKLKGRGFVLNEDVQPICLPETDADYKNLNCTISGFGSIESGKSTSSHQLRAGWIPVQSEEICKMPHVYGDALTDGMFCAGSLDEGVDACDGDSGGPLACLDSGVFSLYGITSWGQHCGYANKPGVYVKVARYRKWIDDTFHTYSIDN